MIAAEDRLESVLRADEGLIDVLVRVSPVFERLRDPATRKVMARLGTVADAARIAEVDVTTLLDRLNRRDVDAPAKERTGMTEAGATQPEATLPPELQGKSVLAIDVRDELRAGREPFSLIMDAVAKLPPDGVLGVRAIFEPAPLYAVLGKRGFAHTTQRLADDDWQVWFHQAQGAVGGASATAAPAPVPEDDVHVLDVRGLEPPEPMVRTLAALESLPDGATLVQVNVRVPQFLLPQLEERGYTWEVREQEKDLVRLFIRRGR